MSGKYGMWQGMPREQIPWHPTVDYKKCKGCKKCFEFCSHHVYGWDEKKNRPKVLEPFYCVVGCSTCAGLCEEKAISFPPLSVLKNFIKKSKI